MTEYANPGTGGGDKLPLADLLGALLRIDVLEALAGVTTTFGLSDPIRANVVALDGEHKAEEWADTLIFPRVLCGQLKGSVGKVVVARLGKGTAKPGQSAPWMLEAGTEADFDIARKYDQYAATKAAAQSEPF